MVLEPAGADDTGGGAPGAGPPRRLIAAGVVTVVVLLVAVAVLATRLLSLPPSASGKATPSASPTSTAALTATAIYQEILPSVVTVRTGKDFGTGVIVADLAAPKDGTDPRIRYEQLDVRDDAGVGALACTS